MNGQDWIRFSVLDQGYGISVEKLPSLFDRFSRTKSDTAFMRSGLGLGLYICSRIIELHGSYIYVEGKLGSGSRFYFDLPVFREVVK